MSDDEEWETDADFENNLTEKEQRAFGNKETMDKYNAVMDKTGGSIPGESKLSLAKPATPEAPPRPEPKPKPQAPAPPTPPPPAPTPPKPTPGKLPANAFNNPAAATSESPARGKAMGKLNLGANPMFDPLSGAKDHLAEGTTPRASPRQQQTAKHVLSRTRRASDQGSKELNELFSSLDTDDSGTLDIDEMARGLDMLQVPMTREKLAAMLKEEVLACLLACFLTCSLTCLLAHLLASLLTCALAMLKEEAPGFDRPRQSWSTSGSHAHKPWPPCGHSMAGPGWQSTAY